MKISAQNNNMKKLLLVAFLALTSISVFSQLTFDQSMMPAIGDTARYQYLDTTAFDPGASTAGTTWDFSSVADSSNSFKLEYVDPSSTPFGGAFNAPGTIASSNGSGDYTFYQSSADSFYIVGEANQFTLNSAAPYTNPLVVYEFPFSSGDVVMDQLSGNYTASGFPAFRTGEDTIEFSGNGTLILPHDGADTTLNNVTRLYKRYHYQDSSNILGLEVINTYDIVSIEWYNADNKLPLMTYWTQDILLAGNPTADSWAYYMVFGEDNMTAIETEELVSAVAVYPNPFAGEAQVDFTLTRTENLSVELFNLVGQRVKVLANGVQQAGNHKLTLNSTGLENGTYMLRFQTGESVVTRKVVIAD